jgi:YggT family protein
MGSRVNLRELSGGAEGNRTPDLCSAIAALSHLSYSPVARLFTCVSDACQRHRRGSWGVSRVNGSLSKRLKELMRAILDIVMVILNLYTWIIIAGAVLSWLIAFGVVNIRNDFVRSIWNLFLALTEPFLRPIRNFLPSTGGIDISPIILLLAVMLIERIIVYYIYPNVF